MESRITMEPLSFERGDQEESPVETWPSDKAKMGISSKYSTEHTEGKGQERHRLWEEHPQSEGNRVPKFLLWQGQDLWVLTHKGVSGSSGRCFILVPWDVFVLRQLHLMVLICASTAPEVTHVLGSCAGFLLDQVVNPPLLICSHFTLTNISVFHWQQLHPGIRQLEAACGEGWGGQFLEGQSGTQTLIKWQWHQREKLHEQEKKISLSARRTDEFYSSTISVCS